MPSQPGAVMVWADQQPWFRVFPIEDELVLGRDLVATGDSTIHARHARIFHGDRLILDHLGTRNPTRLNGRDVVQPARLSPPCLVRTGRTLFQIVDDVTPLLPASWQPAVDAGWVEESCVLILAPRALGFTIARDLACRRGPFVRFDAATMTGTLAERLEGACARTLVLEHPAGLVAPDLSTLLTWLETDLAVATVARDAAELQRLPNKLTRRLIVREIAVRGLPLDDLPHQLWLAAAARNVALHVSVIETALLLARGSRDEELARDWGLRSIAEAAGTVEVIKLEHALPVPDYEGFAVIIPPS